MTEQYQKNMDALKKSRPEFYDTFLDTYNKKTSEKQSSIEVLEAKDGTPIFSVVKDGQRIRLNSLYRPKQEAEQWAAKFEQNNILVNAMLFGLGNGLFAEALIARLKDDATIYIYEPSMDLFVCALQNVDLSGIICNHRVHLYVQGVNQDEFFPDIRKNTHWTNLETQIYCHHTAFDILFPNEYDDFLFAIRKTYQIVQVNKDTAAYFSKKMVANMIDNLVYLRDSRYITDYIEKFPKDIPAIIVAAGPSLDKNIEELKRAKGKSFIVAVDTAMRQLIKHDILPDAMVTIDAGKPFEYMDNSALCEIPLFCMLESSHQILEFHRGLKIWCHGGAFLGHLFERHGKSFVSYNTGGSVATAAFMICVALQFANVVLIGQDLAYQGDVTHAGGEISHVLNEEQGIQLIDGIAGNMVKSRQDWIIYRDWFEESIKDLKDQVRVIDATEGGALIHGSEIMTLHEVIDQYCHRPVDIDEILKSAPSIFDSIEYQSVRSELIGYITDMKNMQKEARQAMNDCDKILRMLKRKEHSSVLVKLQNKVLQTIKKIEQMSAYDLIDLNMAKETNQYLNGIFVVGKDEEEDTQEMFRNTKKIFREVAGSIQEIIPALEKTVQKI